MKKLEAYISNDEGRPMLYVNGIKVAPIIYGLSDIPASRSRTIQANKNIRNFAKQGIDIVQVDVSLYTIWKKTNEFDITIIKEELQGVIEANPNVALIIRIHMNAPYWWMRDNPDELVVYEDTDSIDGGDYERLIKDDFKPMMRVSVASEKWLKEAGEILGKLCQELSETYEGNHVIGIQVAGAFYGEWHQWAYFDHEPDYGICMQKKFRRYLKEKYGSDEKLQTAWEDSRATISTAVLSSSQTRYCANAGNFRDPKHGSKDIDSLKCLQKAIPDAIVYFAEIIKQMWNRPLLTGAFYGYFFNVGHNRATVGGHLEIKTIYDSKAIDYLSGPFPYMNNRRLDGIGLSRGLLESNRLHGILWLTEMDQEPIGTSMNIVGGDEKYHNHTIALLRRNVLEVITRGMGLWYYDHRIVPSGSLYRKFGWWDHPRLLNEIKNLQSLANKYCTIAYKPVADVLLVYDTDSYYHMPINNFAHKDIEYSILHAVGHSGVAYDCIYLDDIRLVDWEQYKCVIFVNTTLCNRNDREFIHEKIEKNNRHIVWLNTPGYSDGLKICIENTEELVGLKMKIIKTHKKYYIISADGTKKRTICAPVSFNPMFAVDDMSAEVVGTFHGNERVAVARKHFSNHTSWYFSIPTFDRQIMQEIFNQAGAHIYNTCDDALLVGSGLLAINTEKGGCRTLCLRSQKKIEVILEPASTTIYDFETGDRLM